jgi:hypothetical protein
MNKNPILILSLLIFPLISYCQVSVKGEIKSKSSNEPIPYVNITKENRQEGTYSNERGEFQINFKPDETLFFSAIGYKKVSLSYDDLKKNDFLVFLEEDITELESVTIVSQKGKIRTSVETIGYHNSKKKTRLVTKTPGFQISTFIENPRKIDGYLETVLINIVSSGKSRLRIRIYSHDIRDGIGQELTRKNLIYDIGRRNGLFTVDLAKENILFPKDGLVIGVEFLGNIGKDNSLVILNGTEVETKIFLSQGDSQRNTWISFMGKGFEKEIYSQIYNSNCNAMIGIKARYYE